MFKIKNSTSKYVFLSNNFRNFSVLNLSLTLPNLQQKKFTFNEKSIFRDLEEEIKKENKFTTLEFRTWDHSLISKNNTISTVFADNDPIFLKINTMEWQILNQSKFQLTSNENFQLKDDFIHDSASELKDINRKVSTLNQNMELNIDDLNKISHDIVFFP